MHPYDLIFLGLAFDIAGALLLAKGFMFKGIREAHAESLMIWGGNSHIVRSQLLQRAEAQVGAFFLIAGFGLQIWGNLHGGIAANQPGWIDSVPRLIIIALATAILASAALALARRYALVQFYKLFFAANRTAPAEIPKDDKTWFERQAVILRLPRRANETDNDFFVRLSQRWQALAAKYTPNLNPDNE